MKILDYNIVAMEAAIIKYPQTLGFVRYDERYVSTITPKGLAPNQFFFCDMGGQDRVFQGLTYHLDFCRSISEKLDAIISVDKLKDQLQKRGGPFLRRIHIEKYNFNDHIYSLCIKLFTKY